MLCVMRQGHLADEDGDEGFFYDEEAAAEGAGGDRESLLEHLDSLIQMPRADEFDHVLLSHPFLLQLINASLCSSLLFCLSERNLMNGW